VRASSKYWNWTAVAYLAAYLVAGAWLVVCLADWLR